MFTGVIQDMMGFFCDFRIFLFRIESNQIFIVIWNIFIAAVAFSLSSSPTILMYNYLIISNNFIIFFMEKKANYVTIRFFVKRKSWKSPKNQKIKIMNEHDNSLIDFFISFQDNRYRVAITHIWSKNTF